MYTLVLVITGTVLDRTGAAGVATGKGPRQLAANVQPVSAQACAYR